MKTDLNRHFPIIKILINKFSSTIKVYNNALHYQYLFFLTSKKLKGSIYRTQGCLEKSLHLVNLFYSSRKEILWRVYLNFGGIKT
jgi:hypothetical protein